MGKFLKITFIIIAILTIFEFLFVRGLFTSVLALIASSIVGIINILFAAKEKQYNEAILYAIATIALNMGYYVFMIQL